MKLDDLNGTYSAVAAAITGMSLAVLTINDGQLSGWDTSGSRYRGTVTISEDGSSLSFDVEMTMPPHTFGIWGTSDTETFQKRQLLHTMPAADFVGGRQTTLPREEMTVVFKRISNEHAELAGPDGVNELIRRLQRAQTAWKDYRG
jgi:hypothetical protein